MERLDIYVLSFIYEPSFKIQTQSTYCIRKLFFKELLAKDKLEELGTKEKE